MRIFSALILAYGLSIFYRSFLSVIAEPFMADLGIGPAQLGAISSAWFISFAVMQFPVGWALDRLGPRRTVTVCMAVGALGAAMLPFATGAWMAMAAMALLGVGFAPVLMAALYLAARDDKASDFARVASLFIGLGSLGNLLGAAPMGVAAGLFGWRAVMGAVAGVFLVALALAATCLRDPPPVARGAEAGDGEGVWAGLRAILQLRALWFLAPIIFLTYAIVVTTRGLWVAPFLGQVNGLDRAMQGQGALAMAVAMTAGAFLLGWCERRFGGPKPVALWSTLAMALCFLALAAFGHVSGLGAILLFAAIGLVGINYAILMSHARLFFPAHLIGRGVTSMNFLFIAGTAIVQIGSGWLIEALKGGLGAATGAYAALHLVFGLLLLVSVAIYARAPARAVSS